MKKILIAVIVMLMLVLSACQPTPENNVVIGKDEDAMLQELNDADSVDNYLISEMIIPDTYTFNEIYANGQLIVSVDANVITPDVEGLPITRVKPAAFSQEMISGMLEFLYGNNPFYVKVIDEISGQTKEQIQTEIVATRAAIANGAYDDEDLMELALLKIENLEKKYEQAPEESAKPIKSDGLMWEDENDSTVKEIRVYGIDKNTNEQSSSFYCLSSEDINAYKSNFVQYSNRSVIDDNTSRYSGSFTMDGCIKVDEDCNIPKEVMADLGFSLSDAKGTVQQFLDASGINYMKCSAAYVIDDHGTGHADNYTGEAKNYAYKLFYSRVVNRVEVLELADVGGNRKYSQPWEYEQFEIIVTKNGIYNFRWKSPCDITKIIKEYTGLISFEKATDIFERMIKIKYEGTANLDYVKSIDIEIDYVKLGLFRIRSQNTSGREGLLVPVWAYYGTVKQTRRDSDDIGYNYGCDYPQGPYIVLAVNAIDGSSIDIHDEN